ncbi:MAG TPA: hypothetical protein VLQ68_12150 [Rhizobiaceae bacterium]|nr:hypothetical protein [Rhizobiaceae bacterium]
MMKTAFALAAIVLTMTGCQRPPEGFFSVSGRIFVFNYRLAYAHYLVTLQRTRAVPEGMRYVARFEDPAGGEPLAAERKIFPAQDKLVIESPHVECVKKDRPYAVKVDIVDTAGKVVQTLETTVVSDLDQSILPREPLVTGPAYQPNANARDAGGKITMRDDSACPA